MSKILAFGTYNVRKHPRVGILIDGLRKHGWVVDEINHPLVLSTAERVAILKKPWKLLGFSLGILRLWIALWRDSKRWKRSNGSPSAVIIGYMGHFDVLLARRLFKESPIILDHLIFAADTAKDRGERGLKVRMLDKLDSMALGAADLVILDTDEHQSMLPKDFSGDSMVVPVGASDEWFASSLPLCERRRSVIFYGLYTPLQGVTVIAKALVELTRRGCSIPATLIGSGQDYDSVRSIAAGVPLLEFIEWVEPERLPAVVAEHTISLGIFSTTPKGLHVVPNKVYQSLAAGCAVITSDTPPQRRMLDDGAVFVAPGDAIALADAIQRLMYDERELAEASGRSGRCARRFTSEAVTIALADWIKTHERGAS